MNFPLAGGRAPTHPAIELDEVLRLVREISQSVESAQAIDEATVERLATELEVPNSHVYAAACMHPNLRFERKEEVSFVVCAGGCQQFGALPLLERLHELRKDRSAAGQRSFDIEPRRCLDHCMQGAVVLVQLPDGSSGGLPQATVEKIEQAVQQICDDT